MTRLLKLFAAVLVVSGLLMATLGTGAFSRVAADRTVSGAVVQDSQAYLAVEDSYGGGTVSNYLCLWGFCFEYQQPRSIADVGNRYATDYGAVDVTLVDVQGGSNDALEVRNVPAGLTVGETATVSLGCTGTKTENGTVDVVIGFEASGSDVTIDGGRITVSDVTYYCADESLLQ
ncbi:MAG: hypothetical protein V5A23_05965 [Halobacteriales archaeon]